VLRSGRDSVVERVIAGGLKVRILLAEQETRPLTLFVCPHVVIVISRRGWRFRGWAERFVVVRWPRSFVTRNSFWSNSGIGNKLGPNGRFVVEDLGRTRLTDFVAEVEISPLQFARALRPQFAERTQRERQGSVNSPCARALACARRPFHRVLFDPS